MSFYPKEPALIGIEASSALFRVATMQKTSKGWKILQLKEIPKEGPVNPLYSTPKEGIASSAILSRDVLVRGIDIGAKKEKDVFQALEFQIEPHLPFPIENAVVSGQILEKKEAAAQVTAYIVKKDYIQKHLASLPFVPEKITCVPYAIAAFASLIHKASTAALWVHVGEEEVTVALVQQGKLLAARAFDKSLDLIKEIQKTILRFSATHKSKVFETIFLLGQGSSLSQPLQAETGKTVLFPAGAEFAYSQEELMRFGLSIGIAMSGRDGPDFRQKEFVYPFPFKRFKKPICLSLSLFILLFVLAFGTHQISISRQKTLVQQAYESLLHQEGKAPDSPTTKENYLSSLAKLEKEIQSRPDTFPLYPQIPKVKEFLAWITTLPAAGKQGAIDITSFHYTMVSKPDFSHRKEHYKIKVEIEFSAENPNAARAFHDALLAPNAFIEAKEEFKWNSSKGKYKAEFFLKDKTRYQ